MKAFFEEVFIKILWLLLLIVLLLLLLLLENFVKVEQMCENKFILLFLLYYSNLTSLNSRINKKVQNFLLANIFTK